MATTSKEPPRVSEKPSQHLQRQRCSILEERKDDWKHPRRVSHGRRCASESVSASCSLLVSINHAFFSEYLCYPFLRFHSDKSVWSESSRACASTFVEDIVVLYFAQLRNFNVQRAWMLVSTVWMFSGILSPRRTSLSQEPFNTLGLAFVQVHGRGAINSYGTMDISTVPKLLAPGCLVMACVLPPWLICFAFGL
jgi:hypothetical protein